MQRPRRPQRPQGTRLTSRSTRPARQKRSHQQRRRTTSFHRHLSRLGGNAAFALLAVAILVTLGALGIALHAVPTSAASGTGSNMPAGAGATTGENAPHLTCGAVGRPACPMQPSVWIPLKSTAPADVLAAVRQSALFTENRTDAGDHVHDLSRLGTPVFVQALQPPGAAGAIWPDFYVIPILAASGNTTDAAEAQLNAPHTAIHVIAIVTYTQPRAHGVIPYLSRSGALAAVSSHAHTMLRPGVEPQLIYFPGNAAAQEKGHVTWTAGGEFPADPLWLVPSTDGSDQIVGNDRRLYTPSQLPVANSQ